MERRVKEGNLFSAELSMLTTPVCRGKQSLFLSSSL